VEISEHFLQQHSPNSSFCLSISFFLFYQQIFLYEVVAQKAVVRESASHSSAVIDRLERGSRVKIDMNSLTGKRAKIIEPLVGWVSLWSAAGFILQKVVSVAF
jgi:hypothetical protein